MLTLKELEVLYKEWQKVFNDVYDREKTVKTYYKYSTKMIKFLKEDKEFGNNKLTDKQLHKIERFMICEMYGISYYECSFYETLDKYKKFINFLITKKHDENSINN